MERNGTKLAREFAYMNINSSSEVASFTPPSSFTQSAGFTHSSPVMITDRGGSHGRKEKKKKDKHPNHRACHSLEKLCDSERSRSNSPMRQGMVALYGTPLRTPKLAKHTSKRVSDTAVYASIDMPCSQPVTNHYAVTYCGGQNDMSDYANICMVPDSPGVVLVKETGSAEGRIELTSQDGKTSPSTRSRSHSFRNSLRSTSFMRFLRRANGKETSRRSRSDGSFDPQDLSQTNKNTMLNFRRERSISLPIKCHGDEEFHRGPALSPEPRLTCDQATQAGHPASPAQHAQHAQTASLAQTSLATNAAAESPKRFHTIHENSFRVRAPRTVSCSAPGPAAQGFDLPKQRTEIETQKNVRLKSRSFSHKHGSERQDRCTSMPISISAQSQPLPRTRPCQRHNSTGTDTYSEWARKEIESPTSESRSKILGTHTLDGEGFVPADKFYSKIVAIDDSHKPRARSSKDYAKVKRRSERLESSETEVSSSPVFDLDMSGDSQASSGHNLSSEASQQLSVSPEPLYVNIPLPRHGAPDRSPNYVNVDFSSTPPATPPQYSTSPQALGPQPLELINPHLNYAVVDMRTSPSGGRVKPRISTLDQSRSPPPNNSPLNYVGIERVDCNSEVRKAMRIVDQAPPSSDLRKARVEPSSEYAQIDVHATVAIQHVCKDRRQNARLPASPLLASKVPDRKSYINRDALLIRDRKGSVP